jgi:tetratricopeptide (TPR) repeat protein
MAAWAVSFGAVRLRITVLAFAFTGSLWAQQTAVLDEAGAKLAMQAGTAAAGRGDLAEAETDFAQAVKLAPGVGACHGALGAVLLAENKVDPAASELEQAESLGPGDVGTTLNLARARVAQGRFADAVGLFRAAGPETALSPEEAVAYATALTATSEPDSAELQDALGSVLAQTGRLDAATKCFRRALELDKGMIVAEYHLGAALVGMGQNTEGIAALKTAAAGMPGSFGVQLELGRALSANHQDSQALVALRQASVLRAKAPADAVYQLALAMQASGDPASALPLFAELVAGTHMTSGMLTNYALAKVQTGDAVGALPLYAKALTLGPDTPTLREDYGAAYLQQNDLAHALDQFNAGLALDPSDAHLHYDVGLALKLKDDLAAAVPEFEKAAALNPTLPDPAYTLGVIYMQQGKSDQAAAQLRRAVALQPANGDAWALLGNVLKDAGDAAGAMDALKKASELEPDQPSLHVELAALDTAAGKKDEAAAERKLAAEMSRKAMNQQKASFALKSAKALLDQGKVPEAVIQLNNAVAAEPASAEPHRLLAEAYEKQGNAAAAANERKTADSLKSAALGAKP